ncbi:MAG: DNA-processing protein DprA [Acidimicrobiales bacterium]
MATTDSDLPPEAWVTALSALDGMGPASLRALLDDHADAEEAWGAVQRGRFTPPPAAVPGSAARVDRLVTAWASVTATFDVAGCWQRHVDAGIGVVLRGSSAYPAAFVDDPEPPPILFHQGDPDVVVGTRVAIVGTRDCTRYGYDLAFELGRDLSAVGISVVSGLALGIDSAAHAGALDADLAPPIAVVGSGLDVIYPRRNGPLWRRVAARGVVWSEYPLGSPAVAWHFPARNRLIAALADVVVVVESHARGGALLTAEDAQARGRPVMAVPGPVHSSSSTGCNDLLADSPPAAVARDATDVLVAIGLESRSRRPSTERRPRPTADDRSVLEAIGWQPATLDHLLLRTGRTIPELASALVRLEHGGWVAPRGGWYERVAKPGG